MISGALEHVVCFKLCAFTERQGSPLYALRRSVDNMNEVQNLMIQRCTTALEVVV